MNSDVRTCSLVLVPVGKVSFVSFAWWLIVEYSTFVIDQLIV